MKLLIKIIFFIVLSSTLFAQDSLKLVEYTKEYTFNEGIFIKIEQVLLNNPIPKSNIIVQIDKNSPDFYEMLVDEEKIDFINENGIKTTVETKNIWGFGSSGRLFKYWDLLPTPVPIIGSIGHFIGTNIITEYSTFSDPYMYNNQPNTRKETKQYIIDFSTGECYEFTPKNIDPIFAKDYNLYIEWSNLSKKKKKNLIFVYLRKYNELHPLMLPSIK